MALGSTLVKSLRSGLKTFFGDDWGDNWGDGSGYFSSRSGSGRVYYLPGTNINWDAATGDLWENPVAQALLNWIVRNYMQAPPVVDRLDANGERVPVPNHPLVELLTHPNDGYDYSALTFGCLLSYFFRGNAYMAVERDGSSRPSELWWVPHQLIRPRRLPGSKNLIDYYEYRIQGQTVRYDVRDIVQMRFGLDPRNPMMGLAPVSSASRDIFSLQQGGTYTARTMRNNGIVGAVASLKDPNVAFDGDQFRRKYQDHVTGDKQGSVLVTDANISMSYPNVTPQDLAIDTILDRPESNVCALFGIDPQVIGIHVGRLSKRFATAQQAYAAAWDECLIPTQGIIGGQIGHKLLPQFGPVRDASLRLTYDHSNVPALQQDKNELHARLLKDWLANLITLADWKMETGRKPEIGDENIRYKDLAPADKEEELQPVARTVSDKSVGEGWADLVERELKALDGASRNGHGLIAA